MERLTRTSLPNAAFMSPHDFANIYGSIHPVTTPPYVKTQMTGVKSGPCPKPIDLKEISLAPMTADDESEESYIFATLLYDKALSQSPENTAASFNRPCPFYLLEHQWTRLQVANWCTSFYRKEEQPNSTNGPSNFLYGLVSAVQQWQKLHPEEEAESLRIKIRSYISGRITTEIRPAVRTPLSSLFKSTFAVPDQRSESEWTVVIDNQPTQATESTMYKTSDRFPYGRARAQAGIPTLATKKEVLLYNTANEILDGSTSTPYFYREGRWVTPTSSCGGLQGVTRRWALENGLCVEGSILKDSLKYGELVWFSNGVKGFFLGMLVPREAFPAPLGEEECRRIELEMQQWPSVRGSGPHSGQGII